jgi:hypothetical protein
MPKYKLSATDQHHTAHLQELLEDNKHGSCQELARCIGISALTVLHILNNKLE